MNAVKMVKLRNIILLVMLIALLAAFARAEDFGCCVNPAASTAICTEASISIDQCCPSETEYPYYGHPAGPKTPAECMASYFTVSDNGCANVTACELGCCCVESIANAQYMSGEIMQKRNCEADFGSFFGENDTQGKTCADFCGAFPVIAGCNGNYSPSLMAVGVKGKPYARLSWINACGPVSFDLFRCDGLCNQATDTFDLMLQGISGNISNFTDRSTDWGKSYTYKIIAYYSAGGLELNYTSTDFVLLGDMQCEEHYSSLDFCISPTYYDMSPYSGYLSRNNLTADYYSSTFNNAYECDADNKLSQTLPCGADTHCTANGAAPVCLQLSGNCRSLGDPFGMNSSRPECEASTNLCFYDRSGASVDQCYDCDNTMSCFDYKTRDACAANHCSIGNCIWRPTYPELGFGFCVDMNRNNCKICSSPQFYNGTPGIGSNVAYSSLFSSCDNAALGNLSVPGYNCMNPPEPTAPIAWFSILYNVPAGSNRTTDQQPEIVANFNAPVTVPSKALENDSGSQFGLDAGKYKGPFVYSYKPTSKLALGNYTFTIFHSFRGQTFNATYSFEVYADTLKIVLLEPLFGYTRDYSFNVTIGTDRQVLAPCRFNISYSLPMPSPSWQEMIRFTQYNTLIRGYYPQIKNVSMAKDVMYMRVNCSDPALQKITGTMFTFRIDKHPPTILSARAYPSLIAESEFGQFKTTIKVTTDEPTVCRYSPTPDFTASYLFDGADEFNQDSYMNYSSASISNLQDHKDYTYYVKCTDLAGWPSEAVPVPFSVNSDAEPTITIINPPDGSAFSFTTLWLEDETNRKGICYFGTNPDNVNSASGSFGTLDVHHKSNPITLAVGRYTYYIQCSFALTSGTVVKKVSTTFVIDQSPPSAPIVDDSNPSLPNNKEYTYFLDALHANWTAVDNQSGIKQYKYAVFEKVNNTLALDWEYTPNNEAGEDGWVDVTLINGKSYYFMVSAQNNAGLWGNNGTSNGITVDTSLRPGYCADNSLGSNETDIDCGGACPACGEGKKCVNNTDCLSKVCKAINSSGKKTCQPVSCMDGIKNGQETDTDCGGTCPVKCSSGSGCSDNTDCATGYSCTSGKCTRGGDTCFNGKHDGDETGIDCGGTCAQVNDKLCSAGDMCKVNGDCEDNLCVDLYCVADSDKDGVSDDADKCPNTLPGATVDADGCSEAQRNNESITCGNGVCETGESYTNCSEDCKKPSSNIWTLILWILAILVIIIVVLFLLTRRQKKEVKNTYVRRDYTPLPPVIPGEGKTEASRPTVSPEVQKKMMEEKRKEKQAEREMLFKAFESGPFPPPDKEEPVIPTFNDEKSKEEKPAEKPQETTKDSSKEQPGTRNSVVIINQKPATAPKSRAKGKAKPKQAAATKKADLASLPIKKNEDVFKALSRITDKGLVKYGKADGDIYKYYSKLLKGSVAPKVVTDLSVLAGSQKPEDKEVAKFLTELSSGKKLSRDLVQEMLQHMVKTNQINKESASAILDRLGNNKVLAKAHVSKIKSDMELKPTSQKKE